MVGPGPPPPPKIARPSPPCLPLRGGARFGLRPRARVFCPGAPGPRTASPLVARRVGLPPAGDVSGQPSAFRQARRCRKHGTAGRLQVPCRGVRSSVPARSSPCVVVPAPRWCGAHSPAPPTATRRVGSRESPVWSTPRSAAGCVSVYRVFLCDPPSRWAGVQGPVGGVPKRGPGHGPPDVRGCPLRTNTSPPPSPTRSGQDPPATATSFPPPAASCWPHLGRRVAGCGQGDGLGPTAAGGRGRPGRRVQGWGAGSTVRARGQPRPVGGPGGNPRPGPRVRPLGGMTALGGDRGATTGEGVGESAPPPRPRPARPCRRGVPRRLRPVSSFTGHPRNQGRTLDRRHPHVPRPTTPNRFCPMTAPPGRISRGLGRANVASA